MKIQYTKSKIKHRGRIFNICYVLRPGAKPAIVYFHGLGNTKEDFLGAMGVAELGEFTLLGFDAPGCGQSQPYYDEIPLGIDDLVEITFKLVTALGLKDLTLVGQSFGGLIALQFACRHGDLVTRFINVEGNVSREDCDIQSRDVFRRRFLGDEERFFLELHRRLATSGKPGFDRFAETFRQNIADRAYFDYCRSIVDYSDNYPLFKQFTELSIPKLFIHGKLSSLSYLSLLAEKGVSVVGVPGSDHFPSVSNPGFFYRTVSRFTHGEPVEA